jgi:hypothetical protein
MPLIHGLIGLAYVVAKPTADHCPAWRPSDE